MKPNPLSQDQTSILGIPLNELRGSQQNSKINELQMTLSQKLAENLAQSVGNTDCFTQIFNDYENDECNDSCDNNLSIACSDTMINDQVFTVLPRLDCATAKRCSETDCIDVEMSVDDDERHVSSNINSCIGFVKFNKIQPIISNKLDNKIILKPMPVNDNSQLETIAKCSNDFPKLLII